MTRESDYMDSRVALIFGWNCAEGKGRLEGNGDFEIGEQQFVCLTRRSELAN